MKKYSRKNLRNIQTMIQDKTGVVIIPDRTWNYRKMATAAAAFVLAAGVVSFPVRALVTSVIRERMESIPKEEVQEIKDMVQSKSMEVDEFSREYSDNGKECNITLWQAYKGGKFPEKVIVQVDNAEDVTEGTLCYIRSTGVINLPVREMTDEEILEIIDFQHKMSYAVSQSPAAQEARAEIDAEKKRLQEKIEAAGGINEDEAIEIARKAMEADIGEKAKELEVCIWPDLASNGWKLYLWDITDWDEYKDKGDIGYFVEFGNKEEVVDSKGFFNYTCVVNAVDGSICGAYSLSGDLGTDWDGDVDDYVWYEH